MVILHPVVRHLLPCEVANNYYCVMGVTENNGRKLKEVFSKSKKEFEEDIRRSMLDMWPGMEVFLDQDDIAFPDDWSPIDLPDETPSTTPPEEEATMKPLETEPTQKPHKKPAFSIPESWPPVVSLDNLYPSRPSEKWPPMEKFPTMRPFDHLPPINRNWDLDLPKYKFVFEHPTPPPFSSAAHTGAVIMKVIGCAVGGFLALLIIATLLDKKNRTRRGVILTAGTGAAGQEILTNRRPSDAGGLFKADLPPPYYECALYSMKKSVDDVPPPYTDPEDGAPQDHKPRQNAFIENELRACSVAVAPDMRTELVFDNGRIVERLSLHLKSNSNETGAASNDNVKELSTRLPELKDRVVYVDETDHVKGNTK